MSSRKRRLSIITSILEAHLVLVAAEITRTGYYTIYTGCIKISKSQQADVRGSQIRCIGSRKNAWLFWASVWA